MDEMGLKNIKDWLMKQGLSEDKISEFFNTFKPEEMPQDNAYGGLNLEKDMAYSNPKLDKQKVNLFQQGYGSK